MFTGTHFRLAGEWSSAGQHTGPVFMCRAFQEFFLQSNCCLTRILFQVEIKEGCGCKVRRISEYESPVTANLLEVLSAVVLKIHVFWYVTLCQPVKSSRRF